MAIAFGAASSPASGSTTALTFTSPSVSGSNTYGVVIVEVVATDTVTSVTWNGVAMSLQIKQDATTAGNVWLYIYTIVNPAAGATNVTVNRSPSGTVLAAALYYTGAQQTAAADNTNSGIQLGSSTSYSQAITTIADNAWMVGLLQDSSSGSINGSVTSGTSRVNFVGNWTIIDNGPQTPAGSISIAGVWLDTNPKSGIVISFAPAGGTATVLPFKSLQGVGK